MKLYLGLDLGTTGCKAVLMDCNMEIHASASSPSPMINHGKVREFNADEFCNAAYDLIRNVIRQYGGPASDIHALSTASASGNTVFLDENLKPLYNAISWTDRRIEGKRDIYLPGFDLGSVYRTTGWPYIGMFPLTHIAWLKRDMPELYNSCRYICMSTEYLLHKMCGNWGLDTSSATTFYLQDQEKGDYFEPYLEYFGITRAMLPPIMPSKQVLGTILPYACADTGLPEHTRIVLGSFDHPACARGMGALLEGDLLLSCGTSWAGLYVTPKRDAAIDAGMLVVPFLPVEGLWACIFAMTQYGEYINARISRFIDGSAERFDVFNRLAHVGKEKDAVYCNIMDEDACLRGWSILSKDAIAYSIMHSTCVDAAERVRQMLLRGFPINRVFMAGGPSSSLIWPQILANCLGRDVYCLHRMYGGAVGAAVMAAIGDGSFLGEHEFFEEKQNQYTVYKPEGGV